MAETVQMDELINAVKEAVDERLETEKQVTEEALTLALEPIISRLEAIEASMDMTKEGINKALGGSKALIGQDLNDNGGVATKSAPRRDAWGRKVRS